jgi:integrase
MKKSGLPKYVIQSSRADGRVRLLYRVPGRKIKTLATPYGTEAFWKSYSAAVTANGEENAAPGKTADGTMRAFVEAYYKLASDYVGGDKLTQSDKKGVLESILAEPLSDDDATPLEHCPVEFVTSAMVAKLRDRKSKFPNAANKRLRYLNMLFGWGVETERAKINPAEKVKKLKVPKKGFHRWTPAEVRQYEARHPVGTKPRLALALLCFTGLRVSDLRQAGEKHVKEEWLTLTQHKNRGKAPKLIIVPILPELRSVINESPVGKETFLETDYGKQFSVKGMSNKVSDWCREAGLPQCSAHGVRKAGATVAAENGASEAQLMAIFGWEDAKEAVLYTREMLRKKMAGEAMHMLVPKVAAPPKSLHDIFELRNEEENPMKSTEWQERRDSNSQPPVLETGALAN